MNLLKIVGIALTALSLGACAQLDEGERGVWNKWGKATGTAEPGFYFYNPISTDLIEYDVKEQKREGETSAYTKDVQNARIKYTLTYALETNSLMTTYKLAGTEWESKYVSQNVERSIKDVIGTKQAVRDVVERRSEVQDAIESRLRARLKKQRVRLASFEITDVNFAKAFEAAVEAKQVAVEKANAAKNRTVEKEELARQKVIAAEADARAIQIKAQALAQNPKYIELERIQVEKLAAEKWNGHLPQNMYGGGAVPFVNVPSTDKR